MQFLQVKLTTDVGGELSLADLRKSDFVMNSGVTESGDQVDVFGDVLKDTSGVVVSIFEAIEETMAKTGRDKFFGCFATFRKGNNIPSIQPQKDVLIHFLCSFQDAMHPHTTIPATRCY